VNRLSYFLIISYSYECLLCAFWQFLLRHYRYAYAVPGRLFMAAPYGIGQAIIFLPWFLSSFFFFLLLSSLFFYSSPNLSGRKLDVYHTSTHGVANLECGSLWNVLHRARGSLEMQDRKNRKKSTSGHQCTTLSGYIFATKAHYQQSEKMLNSNISPTCPYNNVNFGPLAAEIVSLAWGTPANFNGFRILAASLHSILVVGVSETLRR